MAIIRRRDQGLWRPFSQLQDEINRLFDISPGYLWREGALAWTPNVDLFEEKDELVIRADIPGIKKEEINITVEGDTLHLSGERKQEKEVKEKGYYCCERSFGSFHRAITLPYSVDRDKVKAGYKGGVLEIRLPKSEEAREKKIKVDFQD